LFFLVTDHDAVPRRDARKIVFDDDAGFHLLLSQARERWHARRAEIGLATAPLPLKGGCVGGWQRAGGALLSGRAQINAEPCVWFLTFVD
jgi:hypothetical protein